MFNVKEVLFVPFVKFYCVQETWHAYMCACACVWACLSVVHISI